MYYVLPERMFTAEPEESFHPGHSQHRDYVLSKDPRSKREKSGNFFIRKKAYITNADGFKGEDPDSTLLLMNRNSNCNFWQKKYTGIQNFLKNISAI